MEREQAARKEAELQKQHLNTLFMEAPTPVAILRGPRHVIELANRHACQVWGRPAEEVIGKPLLEALPELDGQPFETLLDRVFATGTTQTGEETPARIDWRGDGSLEDVYFNFVYAPLRDVQGKVEGVLALAFDVTEQVTARQRSSELRSKAEDANRAKDEFVAMLSHELRNPLAPILTALELMRLRGAGHFEMERELIARQAKQLLGLVNDLLDVSRIMRGKIEIRRKRVEIGEVVARAIEMASPLIEQRAHHLSVEVPVAGLPVEGDPARLAQVVSNLLSNAAKYTEPGGRIAVRAARTGTEMVLSVEDDGTGIRPDLLPKVFEMFAQEPQQIDRTLGGLGLGLTIVRSIVELHGGTVEASSAGPGRGSTFTVRLPLGPPTQPAVPEASAPRSAPVAIKHRRVLLVDDNEDAAQALGEYLAGVGHTVRIAYDGPAALRIVEGFSPEVALLDIGLPGMDGYELGARLKERFDKLTLVAVTGYAQPSERERTREAGFAAHLVKPIDLRGLVELVEGMEA